MWWLVEPAWPVRIRVKNNDLHNHILGSTPGLIFLPQMDNIGFCRGASEQNINSCLKLSKRVPNVQKDLERWQACHVWPFLGHPQSWTVDPSVKKRLIIKYGRYPWKMSKISMKKWPFFAIVLLWMARYGSETSFLLIFSANDDVVKSFVKIGCSGVPKPTSHPYFD